MLDIYNPAALANIGFIYKVNFLYKHNLLNKIKQKGRKKAAEAQFSQAEAALKDANVFRQNQVDI